MKTIQSTIFIIGLLFAGMTLFQSCAEETPYGQEVEVEEGIHISLTLPYGVNSPMVQTKSDHETEVYDLYVIVFDRYGKFKQKQYYTEANLKTGKLTLETTTGMKKLFAVANVGSNNFNNSPGDLKKQIDDFFASGTKTLAEWLGESASMVDNYTGWTSLEFLLSGRFGKPGADGRVDESGLCLFEKDAQGKGVIKQSNGSALTPDHKIWLDRTISSVTFNIKGYKDNQREVIFHPISWEIRNLPRTVLFYNDYVRDMAGKNKDGKYFTTDTFTPDPDQFDGKIQNGSFQFYMLENGQLDNPFNGSGSLNDLRKTNAPENTAMIVLKGEYEGKETNPLLPGNPTQTAKANVTYYIPLGFVYGDNPAYDFSVRRNHKYTYNVTVKSVNSIIIEATGEKPSSSGDGDVVFKDGITIELDAHYSRIPLTFRKSELIDQNGYYFCSVKTAKTGWRETFITNDPSKQNDADADIDWVLFAHKGVIDNRENGNVAPYGPNFSNPNDYYANNVSGSLYTVRDLMQWLAANYNSLPNEIPFYVYVNEHTYKPSDNIPMDQYLCYRSDMLSSRTRSMKLGLKAAYRKEDNSDYNSSVISSKYALDQLPIVTIFDVQKKQVREGLFWGLECINENVPAAYFTRNSSQEDFDYKAIDCAIPYGRTGTNPSLENDYDGRLVMKNEISTTLGLSSNKVWFERQIMGTKRQDGTWDQHKAEAFAACMSRNRDKNGDGKISDDEIEWYLPSINQYQHFWVGTNAIPERVTLYPQEIREWNYSQRGKGQKRETFAYYASGGHSFQADEGSAVRGWGDKGKSTRRKHVRCARNITASTSSSPAKVEIGAVEDGYGYIVIDASALTSASHRPDGIFTNRTLPPHNEYDPENRLYSKIAVRKLKVTTPYSRWIDLANAIRDGYNPCDSYNTGTAEMERGWRPPNQRELVLITTVATFNELSGMLSAFTYFSMWDWTKKDGVFGGQPLATKIEAEGADDTAYHTRYGFFFNSAHRPPQMQVAYPAFEINSFGEGTRATVRCVKDMK
ncbi:hypothetical protein LJB97_00855 [Parabacteroides sp. OttesenSCG-928-O15]|nr:hypothetical protein [Parabacteroides sp. OttesenSCG-928-O15]